MEMKETSYQDEIDLEELIRVIWRRKLFIITVVVLCCVLTYLLMQQMPNIYRSQVTMMFKKSNQSGDPIQSLLTGAMTAADSTETELELVKNKTMLLQVVDELKLTNLNEFKVSADKSVGLDDTEVIELKRQSAVSQLINSIQVKQKSGTDLVSISYDAKDPVLAAIVVNKIGKTFIEFKEDLMAGKHKQGAELLGSKLEEVKRNLAVAEQKIIDYQNQHEFIDIKNAVALTNRKLAQLHEQKDRLDSDIEQKKILKQHLVNHKQDIEILLSIPFLAESPAIVKQQEQITSNRREFAKLKMRYGPKHPKYVEAKQMLDEAERTLEQELAKHTERVSKQIELSNQKLKFLKGEIRKQSDRLNQLGIVAFDYEKLKREFDANLELYENLVRKQNESELMQDLSNSSNTILIESAEVSQNPVKPNRKLMLVLAALASFIAASFVVLLEFMLSDKMVQYRKIAQRFNTKVIGAIPKIKVKRAMKKGVITYLDDKKHANYIESIRSIRTSILLDKVRSKHKVIAITSISPDDGKSSLAMQLAKCFSEVGKTVLVDADLRFPSIGNALSVGEDKPGLTNVVANSHNLEESIYQPLNFKFDVLTAGHIPKNPLMFLQNKRFKTVISELKEKYQRVILECPPIMSVSDAFIISKCVDSVYLVLDATKANGQMFANVLEELQQAEVEVGGVFVNKIKESNTYSSSKYYGYYRNGKNK